MPPSQTINHLHPDASPVSDMHTQKRQRKLVTLELNTLSCQIVMEMQQAWFSELDTKDQDQFMSNYNEMNNPYDVVDNSYLIENTRVIDQSFQTPHQINPPCYQQNSSSNNKSCLTTEPLNHSSSNTFTISYGNLNPKNEIHQFPDKFGNETTKVPTTSRNHVHPQDHVLAERKRRERMNQHFVTLSSLIPNLKKMDKASVLEDAYNYIKQLQDRVKELEELKSTEMKLVEECFVSMKRSSDDEYSLSEETDSFPEIEVRVSGSSVLVRIQSRKNSCSFENTLNQMQKLGLSVISSSVMPFANNNIIIIILAEIEDDFCITTKELVKNLQEAI